MSIIFIILFIFIIVLCWLVVGWVVGGVIDLLLCLTVCEVSAWLGYFCLQGTGPAPQASQARPGRGGREDPRVTLCFYAEISTSPLLSSLPPSHNIQQLPGRRCRTWTLGVKLDMSLCCEEEVGGGGNVYVMSGVVWCGPSVLVVGRAGEGSHLPPPATPTPVNSTD